MRDFPGHAIRMSKARAKSPATEPPKGKPPIVRDGYSMPQDDYDLIEKIRDLCWDSKPNKSEVLRAGLKALNGMSPKQVREIMAKVVRRKPGRDPAER